MNTNPPGRKAFHARSKTDWASSGASQSRMLDKWMKSNSAGNLRRASTMVETVHAISGSRPGAGQGGPDFRGLARHVSHNTAVTHCMTRSALEILRSAASDLRMMSGGGLTRVGEMNDWPKSWISL